MISFAEFKTFLQLSDDTLEPLFDIYEPIVDDEVSKMTNIVFNQSYDVSFSQNSTILKGGEFYNQDIFVGSKITGAGIPSNTTINNWDSTVLLIDKYTTSSEQTTILINPVPPPLKLTVAKMILYQIKGNTETNALKRDLSSKSMGIVSVSYNDKTSLDLNWNYPKNLVKSCMRYKRISLDIGMSRNPYLASTLPSGYRS